MENLEVGRKCEGVRDDISGVDTGCGRWGMRTGVAGGRSCLLRCASVLSYVSGASDSTISSVCGAMLRRVGYAGGGSPVSALDPAEAPKAPPSPARENGCASMICSCRSRGADIVEYMDAVSNVSPEPVRAIRPARGTARRLWRCTDGALRSRRRASVAGASGDTGCAARIFLVCMRGGGVYRSRMRYGISSLCVSRVGESQTRMTGRTRRVFDCWWRACDGRLRLSMDGCFSISGGCVCASWRRASRL